MTKRKHEECNCDDVTQFKYNKKSKHFVCSLCSEPHICDYETCKHLILNNDRTHVCEITGLCYSQLMCHGYQEMVKSNINEIVKSNSHKRKRDQQHGNRVMHRKDIENVVKGTELNISESFIMENIVRDIMRMWKVIMETETIDYVQRDDKHAVVAAILFSIKNGLKNDLGNYIVHPSTDNKNIIKLNKKKKKSASIIKIPLIRSGQKLLRKAFSNIRLINPFDIDKIIATGQKNIK